MQKMTNKKKRTKRQTYPPSLKREIARRYLGGEFSYGVAAEEYGLKNGNVVKEFVRWYKRQNAQLCSMDSTDRRISRDSASSEVLSGDNVLNRAELLQRIAELERAKREAELRAEGWRTLVRLAEEELDISIVKKSGAEQ